MVDSLHLLSEFLLRTQGYLFVQTTIQFGTWLRWEKLPTRLAMHCSHAEDQSHQSDLKTVSVVGSGLKTVGVGMS